MRTSRERACDRMPQDRAELCACISILAMSGKLTPADEEHVAGWIEFRAQQRAYKPEGA